MVIVLMSPEIPAQVFDGIGVKGGVTYSRLSESGTLPGETGFVTRFSAGVYGDMIVLSPLFFRYELYYSVRGTSRSANSGDAFPDEGDPVWDFTTTRRLAYIEPAMLIGIPLMQSGRIRLDVFSGVSLALNIDASSKADGSLSGEPFTERRNDRSVFLPIDPGLVIGTGAGYYADPLDVTVDIRYTHGLMNIRERGASDIPDIIPEDNGRYGIPKMHTRTIAILIGLGI